MPPAWLRIAGGNSHLLALDELEPYSTRTVELLIGLLETPFSSSSSLRPSPNA